MLFFVQRLQQANAAGDNYCMFSGGVGRDQRRQGFDPFLCVWFWQGFVPGHTCVLAVHTRTHLSLSTESQWPDTYGWHCAETMPLVRLPCAGYLLFILSPSVSVCWCLGRTEAPQPHQKMLEASHSWCAPWLAKVARAQSMNSGREKDTAT